MLRVHQTFVCTGPVSDETQVNQPVERSRIRIFCRQIGGGVGNEDNEPEGPGWYSADR